MSKIKLKKGLAQIGQVALNRDLWKLVAIMVLCDLGGHALPSHHDIKRAPRFNRSDTDAMLFF